MGFCAVVSNVRKLDEAEEKVQKHVIAFCKYLPKFLNCWKSIKNEIEKPLYSLRNLSEQLRYIENVLLKDVEDFQQIQEKLHCSITSCIEEELSKIRKSLETLNKCRHELRNKLVVMEEYTLELNWNQESSLIKGTATQPKLSLLLRLSLDFWNFFSEKYTNINNAVRSLDVKKEKSVNNLENAFKVDLDIERITILLAVTQFVT